MKAIMKILEEQFWFNNAGAGYKNKLANNYISNDIGYGQYIDTEWEAAVLGEFFESLFLKKE